MSHYLLAITYINFIKYIFHEKINSMLTEWKKIKSGDQYPDPDWFGSLDPDPH
jgi:hypothetical protein